MAFAVALDDQPLGIGEMDRVVAVLRGRLLREKAACISGGQPVIATSSRRVDA